MLPQCHPAVFDYVPNWGRKNNGHSFCSVIRPDGSVYVFQDRQDNGTDFSYPSDKLLLASLLPLAAGAVLNDNTAHNRIRIRLIAVSVAAVAAVWVYMGSGIGHPAEKYAGTPNCETWCDLGEACEGVGDYGRAENYYRTASYMVPTRLRPNYLLWKLYIGSGRETEAREMARKILSMPLKVENTFTLRVRDEVRKAAERGVLHQGHR